MTRFQDLIGQCSYPGLTFELTEEEGPRWFLRVTNADGWHGRKWRLSRMMTDGEVVQTAFKAVITFVEHEAREHFTFQSRAVFGPHLDIYKLVAIADDPVTRPPMVPA